ncbi:hypothetical protein B9479_003360 [Cryptococcus floricola]|uniref:Uncharacterized protein n=1 Tax=Cryptococcus floricola TaxID=2591691 RepID=A0A5D3AX83_9TREE|nr:hypothetical protein B9479_003360 [Cryptococcus floricola]
MVDRVPTPMPAGYQQRRHSDDDRLHLDSLCFSSSNLSPPYVQPLHFKMTPLPAPTPPSLLKRAKSLEQSRPRRHVHSHPQSPPAHSHSLPPSHHHHVSGLHHTPQPHHHTTTTTATAAGGHPPSALASATRRHAATTCDIPPLPHRRQRSSSLISVSSIPSPPLPLTPGLDILPELADESFELFPPADRSAVERVSVMADGYPFPHDPYPGGISLGEGATEMEAVEKKRSAAGKRRTTGGWDVEEKPKVC